MTIDARLAGRSGKGRGASESLCGKYRELEAGERWCTSTAGGTHELSFTHSDEGGRRRCRGTREPPDRGSRPNTRRRPRYEPGPVSGRRLATNASSTAATMPTPNAP